MNESLAFEGLAELDQIALGSVEPVFRTAARQGTISAWWGHVPFAQWLIHVTRPGNVVELGTHNGVSYAAFCSSIVADGIDCRCTAVDTWRGDRHAGEYDNEIFTNLKAWHDDRYAGFSTLMRCTFDEALPQIEDGSVDLLHIDGLHTYEAARHDFESWLPKLSRRGVVLLHDTEERIDDFGVWRLWAELQERYPSFGQKHSHGLGLLAVGEEAPKAVQALCATTTDPVRAARIQTLFAVIGRRWAAESELLFEVHRVTGLRQDIDRERDETARLRLEVEREKAKAEQEKAKAKREKAIAEREKARAEREKARAEREKARAVAVVSSTTWRMTGSLRTALARAPAVRRAARGVLRLGARVARRLGLVHFVMDGEGERREIVRPVEGKEAWLSEVFRIVPYYLNPHLQRDPSIPSLRLAVHLHLYYEDMTESCIGYLRNIPARFDLFVSVPGERDTAALTRRLASALPEVGEVHVETVPNRGRDIAPLIVQFGARLRNYDVIGHFHTKKSPHKASLSDWFDTLMATLCGSRKGVGQILELFGRDAKVVYPAGNKTPVDDNGWSDNLPIAERILTDHELGYAEEFPFVEFPEGTMFWARADSLSRLFGLRIGFNDFPEEPIPPDGTLAHALERLILVLAQPEPGRNYRLEVPGLSREPLDWFEAQQDFSGQLRHETIKVLAYYLPQFHPTPENSAWHGEGFTEWHKVQGAYPLFDGHYQQHVPHPHIGYYHLDSPAQLEKQAGLMRKAGVHGMIFYHYWFSGRLILEKPAQMLLEHLEIAMPFCFCWANENWTRRWDGNEQEILLGQVYSPEDAGAFIRYLIPFFRDERYIKVEGRPLLLVYRPASIQGAQEYFEIWKRECETAGLPAPYLVAVLTRGATSPLDYGMDAGAERVLHDWLGAAARDIRSELRPYWPVSGSVLDYSDIVSHYTGKTLPRDYPLFRSLVPIWDNTARYGSEAYLIHGFTPEAMQRWFAHLISDAEKHLPADRRFIIVNAWNEWAEGAHLEPDMRYGYAYLNAIGRALSDRRFDSLDNVRVEDGLTLTLELERSVATRLQVDADARCKFVYCITSSTVLARCRLLVSHAFLARELSARGVACEVGQTEEATFTLCFSDLFLFPETTLERMLQMGLRYQGQAICATPLNNPAFLCAPSRRNWQISNDGRTGLELRPRAEVLGYKICTEARCFRMGAAADVAETDRVSTIIRFHGGRNRGLLTHALFSLLAQGRCRVRPCIGVQDLEEPEASALQDAIEALPWSEGCRPVVRFFKSSPGRPDLRSEMLHQMLRAAGQDYAAILDYDDVLFPNAYDILLRRLKATGKNATFARVYATVLDANHGAILRREKRYDAGLTYDDFLERNHAPIHSFMLDLRKIDLNAIEYFSDMKFLEDYYLILQIFTPDDTDWDSLKENVYIGDYIHLQGSDSNTLAIEDVEQRRQQLLSSEYQLAEDRIDQMRRRIRERRGSRQPASAD